MILRGINLSEIFCKAIYNLNLTRDSFNISIHIEKMSKHSIDTYFATQSMQTCQTTVITTSRRDVTTMQKYFKYTIIEEVTFFMICAYNFFIAVYPF